MPTRKFAWPRSARERLAAERSGEGPPDVEPPSLPPGEEGEEGLPLESPLQLQATPAATVKIHCVKNFIENIFGIEFVKKRMVNDGSKWRDNNSEALPACGEGWSDRCHVID